MTWITTYWWDGLSILKWTLSVILRLSLRDPNQLMAPNQLFRGWKVSYLASGSAARFELTTLIKSDLMKITGNRNREITSKAQDLWNETFDPSALDIHAVATCINVDVQATNQSPSEVLVVGGWQFLDTARSETSSIPYFAERIGDVETSARKTVDIRTSLL